jgi:hypothetical protein
VKRKWVDRCASADSQSSSWRTVSSAQVVPMNLRDCQLADHVPACLPIRLALPVHCLPDSSIKFSCVAVNEANQKTNPQSAEQTEGIGTIQITNKYRFVPHNDVSVNDGPHIRRWSLKIIII